MRLRALAKINLGLDVVGKRDDGYHEVRMIMQTIQMYDVLEIEKKKEPGIVLTTNIPYVPTDERNLVYKAAKMLMDEFDIKEGLTMNLEKFIPVAAGMAGGSSDAAAAFVGVNRLFGLGLSEEELMKRAVKVGADVPYCVMRGTALAEGIGEKLTRLPRVPHCYVLVGKPGVNVSTKTAYENLKLDDPAVVHPDIDGMVTAVRNGVKLAGGNYAFIRTQTEVSEDLLKQSEALAEQGKTPMFFSENGRLAGIIAVADMIKEDSPQAVKELQNMGIRVVMLTGDNERTARAIGAQAGVDDVIAGVLPDGKESVIRSLKEQGKVAMVGDGINDAPALTRADIGIAIGAGTDVAIDAADVVLMKSRLSDVPAAIRLSRATLRNIHENLFWAFFYNVIGIPLAAGVWIPIFGWTLNPMFGAAAMSLSSFCVVTNALRLNLFKVHDASRDKKIKQNVEEIHYISANAEMKNVTENKSLKAENPDFCNSEIHDPKDQENIKENKENKEMTTITVNVTGMMCGHCEAHVTKAVKEAFGVEDVVSSHEKGTTVIHAPEKLDEDKIREVIKEAGYEVTGITQE